MGLGNPGPEFAGTRHNVGAEAVSRLAERHGGRLRTEKGLRARACQIELGGHRVLLAVPETYMNESGLAVAPLVRRAGIDRGAGGRTEGTADGRADGTADGRVDGTADGHADGKAGGRAHRGPSPGGGTAPTTGSRLIVVHDELDLPSGRLRVKSGGGTAGNNGLRSIDSHLHTNAYLRVRVGIGKPPGRQPGADYVLKRPGAAERQVLAVAVEEAADAVELIVTQGVSRAMTQVNGAG